MVFTNTGENHRVSNFVISVSSYASVKIFSYFLGIPFCRILEFVSSAIEPFPMSFEFSSRFCFKIIELVRLLLYVNMIKPIFCHKIYPACNWSYLSYNSTWDKKAGRTDIDLLFSGLLPLLMNGFLPWHSDSVYCNRLLHVEPSFTYIFPFIFMEATKATL